ncbi:CCA tRNA nucleotidyltransferase [Novosphingobium ginsenosidimutans]|uniref:CCA tRNA nucleotidyltransferase n=1 Tax=Novosphingobium ginsenosidimutans TaxID=1176536 RepID=A0A5B8SAK0_9SPHN|nr:CCA tRNA nucleotidyltransferase [Novosphingobium ginsenosidimutans]QEA17620.1 CCA tRNA nucleotidyltransferase [Novosphingobium ginsenosidimutans]
MTLTLPAADWTRREDLALLVAALGPGQSRYVGGAVRDTLLGIAVKDVDLATPLEPRAVMQQLKSAGIQVVPTGIEHGTVTAVLPQGPVEITTLRHDVSTDGRRATVAFASDWQDDAARRDFTINALYADPATGEIFDWFGGLDDLAARRVRFIGDPHQRIREDHLRILRYFRFQARFGSMPADAPSESACAELAAMLKGLSRERVGMEMMNLLSLTDPAPTVARMAELGVLEVVLPEADVVALAALVAEEVRQRIAPDALRRLAALLPADVQLAEAVASRFRLSGAQKKRLALAAAREGTEQEARPLAYRLGIDGALDRLLIAGTDVAALDGWTIPEFPLKGGEIVARGIKAGPEVARVLRRVESGWIAAGFADSLIPALLDAELSEQA